MVFVLCLDNVPILSDVVVVHSVIHFKTLSSVKWTILGHTLGQTHQTQEM